MSTEMVAPIEPLTRRAVWLQIALAVAAENLPEPESLSLYTYDDGGHIVCLDFISHALARAWARWLECSGTERSNVSSSGRHLVHFHADRHGWRWQVIGREPTSPPDGLAARVVAAILTPDAAVAA